MNGGRPVPVRPPATVGAVRRVWPGWGGQPAAASESDGAARPLNRRVMAVVGPAMGLVWVVFLVQPWLAAWRSHVGLARDVSLAAVAGLALSFAWTVVTRGGGRGERMGSRGVALVLGGQAVLVGLSTLAAAEQGLVGLVFLSVSAVFLICQPRALLVPLGASAVVVGLPRVVPGWLTTDGLVLSVLLASFAVFGFTQLVQRNRQLQLAQAEVAVLAVERERERIARDMHDILGHSLTVIAVKAELAGKLFELDPERSRAEMAQVQALARGALADVRGMVSATRAVTLAGELAGARQAFDAAGVQAQVPGSVDDVPEHLRELFAWALREGTTNVLRHAAASRVEVTMTADSLVVDDDGHGPSGGAGGGPTAPGNGLHGLTERARAARARLEVSTSPLGGYRLAVIARNEGR